MNRILFVSCALCWVGTQSNRNIVKRLEVCKRFALSGFVLTFLLTIIISHAASQSQQTTRVTINQAVQEAVEKNLSLLAERRNLSVADARISAARLRPNPVLSLYGDPPDLAGAGFDAQNTAGPPEYRIRAVLRG
ncbi:MAG TPA: hypothetical protein VIC84_02935 [Blastocatellia bacterium]|jgi:hypothetical protein